MTNMYKLTAVGKSYRKKGEVVNALTDVKLEIQPRQLVTIQGPTGGGKSTLLQLLGGMELADSGSLQLDGEEVRKLGSRKLTRLRAEKIGFIFQGFNLIPTLTALENVEMALVPLKVSKAERRQRAVEALQLVGLADRQRHYPSELSGGQQQRVAIARALVKKPEVILADEPTAALDEETRDEIISILIALAEEEGITLIIVTHDSAVAAIGNPRLRIKHGRVEVKAATEPALKTELSEPVTA